MSNKYSKPSNKNLTTMSYRDREVHIDRPLTAKEKYKYAKSQLKTSQRQTEDAKKELIELRQRIKTLKKQNNEYLTKLATKELDRETSSEEEEEDFHDPEMIERYKHAMVQEPSKHKKSGKGKSGLNKEEAKDTSKGKGKKKPRISRDLPRKVVHLPHDENGQVILPCKVGIYTVHELGKIDYERPTFHSQRYIYPIGLKITRYYRSTVNPDVQALYTSTIVDNGTGPQFQVYSDDNPKIYKSDTSSGAWAQVIREATEVRNLSVTNSGSGPEFYGLAHPAIAYMIQNMPNSDKCKDYKPQTFIFVDPPPNAKNQSSAPKKTKRGSPKRLKDRAFTPPLTKSKSKLTAGSESKAGVSRGITPPRSKTKLRHPQLSSPKHALELSPSVSIDKKASPPINAMARVSSIINPVQEPEYPPHPSKRRSRSKDPMAMSNLMAQTPPNENHMMIFDENTHNDSNVPTIRITEPLPVDVDTNNQQVSTMVEDVIMPPRKRRIWEEDS